MRSMKWRKVFVSIYCFTLSFVLVFSDAAGSAGASPNQVSARVAMIHFNPQLGQLDNNINELSQLVEEAYQQGANIVVTPELSTIGYFVKKDQVLSGLGIAEPYDKLSPFEDLAQEYGGYIFMGFAELDSDGKAYNSVAVFGPDGYIQNQRKRTLPGWNERGNIELNTIDTEFGKIGTIVCADSYSPDYTRLLALNGADIIVLPSTWWGDTDQESTWKTRARESGVWFVVANRWGGEYDDYSDPPYYNDMNDAPSAVVSPYGSIELIHRANDDVNPQNKVLLHDLTVDLNREVYSLNDRSPSSYAAIGNEYYRPDLGNVPAPNLPNAGITNAVTLSYIPSSDHRANINKIKALIQQADTDLELVVLPAYGLTNKWVDVSRSNWYSDKKIAELQKVVNKNKILALSTVIHTIKHGVKSDASLLLQANKRPVLIQQLHDSRLSDGTLLAGSHQAPFYLDLPNARVGVITGRDYMFPETTTALAKIGTDIILVSSNIMNESQGAHNFNYVNKDYLTSSLETLISHGVHFAFSDSSGFSEIIESEWGIELHKQSAEADGIVNLTLDSSLTRYKYLNVYFNFDLDTLIGTSQVTEYEPNIAVDEAA